MASWQGQRFNSARVIASATISVQGSSDKRVAMVTETPQAVIGAAVARRGERKLASLEAVERRRLSRRAKKLLRRMPRSEEETAIKSRMATVVARMVRRYVPHDRQGEALLHEYDYWSLRRLGCDV